MERKERAEKAVELLKEYYPDAECTLDYTEPYRLVIATRLAAQCTDARVNMVTPGLFEAYPTIESLAEAPVEDVERLVHSCGFYKMKAKDIVGLCKMLHEEYNDTVPDTMEELLKLPGVGRKTANLVLGDVFHKPAVVCDTHCIRITNLLGLSNVKAPERVERQLREVLPPDESNNFCHRLVMLGREVCVANRPKCAVCPLKEVCTYGKDK